MSLEQENDALVAKAEALIAAAKATAKELDSEQALAATAEYISRVIEIDKEFREIQRKKAKDQVVVTFHDPDKPPQALIDKKGMKWFEIIVKDHNLNEYDLGLYSAVSEPATISFNKNIEQKKKK